MFIECDGNITVDINGVPSCDGPWIAHTAEELAASLETVTLTQLFDLLNSLVLTPTTEELATLFMSGLTVPLLAYLVASQYGVVINWFK